MLPWLCNLYMNIDENAVYVHEKYNMIRCVTLLFRFALEQQFWGVVLAILDVHDCLQGLVPVSWLREAKLRGTEETNNLAEMSLGVKEKIHAALPGYHRCCHQTASCGRLMLLLMICNSLSKQDFLKINILRRIKLVCDRAGMMC